jgi:hypothetical protein
MNLTKSVTVREIQMPDTPITIMVITCNHVLESGRNVGRCLLFSDHVHSTPPSDHGEYYVRAGGQSFPSVWPEGQC